MGVVGMTMRKMIISAMVVFIAVSAGIACTAGIRSGMSDGIVIVVTPRGEVMEFQSEGVYQYNPRWFAAEGIGWDIASIVIAIPALLISLFLFTKGSIRGGITLAGLLAYFAYQYLMYVTGWAYNNLFLLYTALYSISIVALIAVIQEIGVDNLAARMREGSPRKSLAGFMFFISAFLLFMWLGKIVPATTRGETPEMLNGAHTLIAQALDLGLLVPFGIAAGVLLLKRNAWGYLLASIGTVKLIMMAVAIVAMVVVRSIIQRQSSWVEIAIFSAFAAVGTAFFVALLHSFDIGKPETR